MMMMMMMMMMMISMIMNRDYDDDHDDLDADDDNDVDGAWYRGYMGMSSELAKSTEHACGCHVTSSQLTSSLVCQFSWYQVASHHVTAWHIMMMLCRVASQKKNMDGRIFCHATPCPALLCHGMPRHAVQSQNTSPEGPLCMVSFCVMCDLVDFGSRHHAMVDRQPSSMCIFVVRAGIVIANGVTSRRPVPRERSVGKRDVLFQTRRYYHTSPKPSENLAQSFLKVLRLDAASFRLLYRPCRNSAPQ